jgi:flavin reductase (DIM6/NTAB) family NADH-FMN oxidoreductase RutF
MTMRSALEPARLRRVFGSFPTGVTVVAALVDGVPTGMAASSFVSVSLEPALISICTAHTSTTCPCCAARPGSE